MGDGYVGANGVRFKQLEDAQAFCEKNALDVEEALRGGAVPSITP